MYTLLRNSGLQAYYDLALKGVREMKKVTLFANASIASIAAATIIAAPVFACKPVGSIVKSVQDQTTNSATVSSNKASNALSVNAGDTLVYTITVKNSGAAESNGDDDMLNVQLSDALPTGVQLVSNPTETKISESLGTIKRVTALRSLTLLKLPTKLMVISLRTLLATPVAA